jgi:hypothetical protein
MRTVSKSKRVLEENQVIDYSDAINDVGVQDYDAAGVQVQVQEDLKADDCWFGSFLFFHPVDVNAVAREAHARKERGAPFTKEEMRKLGQETLEKRAAELGKSVDELTALDRLDTTAIKFKPIEFYATDIPGAYKVISRLGKEGPENDKYWLALGKPKTHYTTIFLRLPTKKVRRNGVSIQEFDRELFESDPRGSVQFCLLDLTSSSYKAIRDLGPKMPLDKAYGGTGDPQAGLHNYDVIISVKPNNVTFKTYDCAPVGPAKYLEYAKQDPTYLPWVLSKAKIYAESIVPSKYKSLSTKELREKMAGTTGDTADKAEATRAMEAANTASMLSGI